MRRLCLLVVAIDVLTGYFRLLDGLLFLSCSSPKMATTAGGDVFDKLPVGLQIELLCQRIVNSSVREYIG